MATAARTNTNRATKPMIHPTPIIPPIQSIIVVLLCGVGSDGGGVAEPIHISYVQSPISHHVPIPAAVMLLATLAARQAQRNQGKPRQDA